MGTFNKDKLRNSHVLAGFDGYIDKLLLPICQSEREKASYYETIRSFGVYLQGQAGKSCSVQMDLLEAKIGGNAPILSGALSGLGAQVTLVGLLGEHGVLPVFKSALPAVELYSYGAPWESLALEFKDGKIMLAPRSAVPANPLVAIEEAVGGKEALRTLLTSDLLVMSNWGEIDYMHGLWKELWQQYFSSQPPELSDYLFIDPADLTRHKPERIQELAQLLKQFSRVRTTVLSVNDNELARIYMSLTGKEIGSLSQGLQELGRLIPIQRIVVHTRQEAISLTEGVLNRVATEFVANPVCSTGAGDNFNAGYCAAMLMEQSPETCLRLGNYASSHFVATGKSITMEDLTK